MLHYYSLDGVSLKDSWVTIGSFDGVHLGHQAIINSLTAGAHKFGAPAVVLTFFPHPALVLQKRQDPYYLTSPDEQAALLGELGVDAVITYPFTREVAALSARQFMTDLSQHLDLRHLCVGYDFALGRGREGNVPRLQEIGRELDYEVSAFSAVKIEGEVISSSQIRAWILAGEVEKAAEYLGRPFQIPGEVVHGDGRGRTIGIPTANLSVWPDRVLPKEGVYVSRAQVGGDWIGAVANIGVRPTFENQPVSPRVEAHLFDFDQDLYGQTIRLEILSRLRDEQRFPSIDALISQIRKDIARARQLLELTA